MEFFGILKNNYKFLLANNEKKFKITIIGKGEIKDVPYWMKDYFVVKGRLSFRKMYDF